MLDKNDFAWMNEVNWFGNFTTTFFTLKENSAIATINAQLENVIEKNVSIAGADFPIGSKASELVRLSTLPLKDIQLKSAGGLGEMKHTGSLSTVIVLISIAGLILLIACINFINLSTARSLQRAKEVVLRKVLGAKRQQLIVQFMSESVLTVLAALLLGLVLMELALPAYNSFLGRTLVFNYFDGPTIGILIGLVAAVGLLAGLYPALIISGFLPT